jgi:hypothetical protein
MDEGIEMALGIGNRKVGPAGDLFGAQRALSLDGFQACQSLKTVDGALGFAAAYHGLLSPAGRGRSFRGERILLNGLP